MNKKLIITIILLLVIGGAVFFIVRKPEEEVEETGNTEEVVNEETDSDRETDESQDDEWDSSSTDFSSFSVERQVLGQQSEEEFTITGVSDQAMDGYHQVKFTLETEGEDEPFVSATYIQNTGVIRLDFQGIGGDSSGLGYQQEESLNRNGVLRIYHNVSAQQDQELYDIGVTKSTPFHLSSNDLGEGEWEVILKVKYPGTTTTDIDMGSEEFSREDQNIEGIVASDGATISSYTYGRPSGLLKFVWVVSGTDDNPVPSVSAEIDSDGVLVVTFPSLRVDRVASTSQMVLNSGIELEITRVGGESVYRFLNVPESSEYRLSATLSPNQVVLEIQ